MFSASISTRAKYTQGFAVLKISSWPQGIGEIFRGSIRFSSFSDFPVTNKDARLFPQSSSSFRFVLALIYSCPEQNSCHLDSSLFFRSPCPSKLRSSSVVHLLGNAALPKSSNFYTGITGVLTDGERLAYTVAALPFYQYSDYFAPVVYSKWP